MKCNPWRWLWGLIPILMLGWIAVLAERDRIEADLASRSQIVLQRSGHDWAKVRFDGRDAVLLGKAVTDDERAKATRALLDTFGVRIADDRSSLLEKVERFEWSAIRRDGRIRIDGVVPTERARSDVLGMIKAIFPSIEVDDRTKLARGAPPIDIWLGGVGFGLKQLASLKQGRVDIENTSLSVSGDAIDAGNYRRVRHALAGRLPQGIRLKAESVRPPLAQPYVWSARRKDKDIVLAGHVPSETVREALLRAARNIDGARVIDQMEPAAGEPENFSDAASQLLEQLRDLDDGKADIRDTAANLVGTAESAKRAGEIKAALDRGALSSYRAVGKIGHREPRIKTISPYVTAVVVTEPSIELTGHVPDDDARAALFSLVRRSFPDRNVADKLDIGAGQPPGWAACMEAGMDAVRRLGEGRAVLTDRRLAVSGKTDNEALAQALPGEVRAVVGSSCDADVRVALDMDAVRAREEERRRAAQVAAEAAAAAAANQRTAAAPAAPDTAAEKARAEAEAQARAEEERRRAEAEAQARAEEERRRAEAEAQARAEEERRRAEAAAQARAEEERRRAEAAAQVRAEEERRRAEAAAQAQTEEERRRAEAAAQARAEEERRRAEAAAQARAEEERRRAEAAAQARAEEERRRAEAVAQARAEEERRRAEAEDADRQRRAREIARREADACQEALSRVNREGVINFDRAKFNLQSTSYPTLNRIAEAANRCPEVVVEIEGHTDSEGTPERNQRLSDRRANAVRDYLTKAGVAPDRLTAIGYGQDRNIAPNDTPENRAKNRRIEFTVKFQQ